MYVKAIFFFILDTMDKNTNYDNSKMLKRLAQESIKVQFMRSKMIDNREKKIKRNRLKFSLSLTAINMYAH